MTRTSAPSFPADVAALAASPFLTRFEGGAVTASTNDDCRALGAAGAQEGTVVVALEQTAGRGRLGRTWASPPGGVYLSLLLRPTLEPARLAALPLVAGVGVAAGLETLGARVALKWPNDVLAAADEEHRSARPGPKVAGILVESKLGEGGAEWVVVGCGVNVSQPAAAAAATPGAGSLEMLLGTPPDPARVAAAVLDGVAGAYERFLSEGFGTLADDYEARSALTGERVCVSDAAGTVTGGGLVLGVDEEGALVLDDEGTRIVVTAGDVTLRPAQRTVEP